MKALVPVSLSALALTLTHGIAGHFIKGGAIVSLIPYLFGWICAVIVFKIMVKVFPLTSPEEDEVREAPPKGASTRQRLMAVAVATPILVAVNVLLYLFSGGGEPRGGFELLLAAAIGVTLKPFLEEILFRYMYLKEMVHYGRYIYPIAIGAQATYFALWHDPKSLVFAFFGGVVLGEVAAVSFDGTEKGFRRGFVNALSVHVLHNLILYVIEGCVGY